MHNTNWEFGDILFVMEYSTNPQNLDAILKKLATLQNAISNGKSKKYCLQLWSQFVRERDGNRCVDCHSQKRLAAHHICRKSLLEAAQYQPGNGITLCNKCHREIHQGFNGSPDLKLPVDSQAGEKLRLMQRLYYILQTDAFERHPGSEELYFLNDTVLNTFKRMQGYSDDTQFFGSRLMQAYQILASCELNVRKAILEANGFETDDTPIPPGHFRIIYR